MILAGNDEKIMGLLRDAAGLIDCNCGSKCEGTCTHSEIEALLAKLKEDDEEQKTEAAEAYRKAAKEEWHSDGEVEVDEGSIVSFGDADGAYVAAWVWVGKSEAGICRECGEEESQ